MQGVNEVRIMVDASARATEQVRNHQRVAVTRLTEDRANAYGILMEPFTAKSHLLCARDEINAAIALIEATKWPTEDDYNQL